MQELSPTAIIWNRACSGDPPQVHPGDVALSGLLRAHNLTMNGGVLHAVECLDDIELAHAESGYRFYGLGSAASVLSRAKEILDQDKDPELHEAELDEQYSEVVPDDDFLFVLFEEHLRLNSSEYSPAEASGGAAKGASETRRRTDRSKKPLLVS